MSSTSPNFRPTVLVVAATVALCGCASAPGEDETSAWRPIDLALTAPMDQLRADAQLGRASAQYALSIVDRYGLRGARPDPKAADAWLSRALRVTRVTVKTALATSHGVYFAEPTQARPEVDMRFDLSPAQDSLTRGCLGLLADPPAPPQLKRALADGGCGGGANYDRLKAAWLGATGE